MAELASRPATAAVGLAVNDDPHADALAEGHDEEVVESPPVP